jgi:hypothetical protein
VLSHLISWRVSVQERIQRIKQHRRSVDPRELHEVLVEAGFTYRRGGRNHVIYSHPGWRGHVSIKQSRPLLPAYVSLALHAIEEVLGDEDD